MTVLAFGCSVTHGTEIAALGNSKDNIPFSYPALVADYLGVDCVNRAFCGNSNENIFHEAIDTIPQYDNITAVIVGWTSLEREVWQCENRTWQFIPSWCATAKNVWNPFMWISPRLGAQPQKCADKEEYIQVLDNIYEFLIKYKFDSTVYSKKRDNYISTLRAYCLTKHIKLIETCWSDVIAEAVDIGSIGTWYPSHEPRHPNKDEQKMFAEQIINHYKL